MIWNFFLQIHDVMGLSSISEEIENEMNIYIKLFALLYADDTVLFAESAESLHSQLNTFSEYCKLWKLSVNSSKTKIIIFSGERLSHNPHFYFDNIELNVVKRNPYLGLTFSRTGSFANTKRY